MKSQGYYVNSSFLLSNYGIKTQLSENKTLLKLITNHFTKFIVYAEVSLMEDSLNKTDETNFSATSSTLPYCKINECNINSVCFDYQGITFCSCKSAENQHECLS